MEGLGGGMVQQILNMAILENVCLVWHQRQALYLPTVCVNKWLALWLDLVHHFHVLSAVH